MVVLPPHLIEEWDLLKNPTVDKAKTKDQVWWLCSTCKHTWKATIANRIRKTKPTGCPKCNLVARSLKAVTINNLVIKHPDLVIEWFDDRSPHNYSSSSHVKVKWKCKVCQYIWQACIYNRTGPNQSGCPQCKHFDPTKTLETLHPHLLSNWHPTKNIKEMRHYMAASHEKVWWICNEGHEFVSTISNITYLDHWCPYCSGRLPSDTNRLDLYADPLILSEFCEDKTGLPTSAFTVASSKLVYWNCPCGNIYQAKIVNRTVHGTGCPKCIASGPEQLILKYLDEKHINYVFQYTVKELIGVKGGMLRFDFYLKDYNIIIEFDGKQHTKCPDFWGGSTQLQIIKEHDDRKNKWCKDNAIQIVRINSTRGLTQILDGYLNVTHDK